MAMVTLACKSHIDKKNCALQVRHTMKNAHEQTELFGPGATLHGVLGAAGGPAEAVRAAALAASNAGSNSLERTLAGRTGRIIADTAAAALQRDIEGGSLTGYSYSAWCLAGLPHRELPAGDAWLIESDYARLLVRPGIRLMEDGSQVALAVPSGSFARLLLVELQSAALEKASREVDLEVSASALVARLGLARGGPTNGKVAAQLERIATCNMDFAFGTDKRGVVVNQRLVDAYEYVAEPDRRTRASLRLVRRLALSEPFYQELRRHPVLVDKRAIQDLASSPMAIDLYLWLAYRLHALEDDVEIGWVRLKSQFGSGVRLLKNFKTQLLPPLYQALAAYPGAKVTVTDRGVLLRRSASPIAA